MYSSLLIVGKTLTGKILLNFIGVFREIFVVLISDDWFKYFYPVFAMSCYIIIMRVF
jgi:hypothetical protein